MFNAADVFSELGFPKDSWQCMMPGWGAAMVAMPENLPVLDTEELRHSCETCSLSPEMQARIMETADVIRATPALKAFLWHACYKMSIMPQCYGIGNSSFNGWAFPEKHLRNNARLLYTLVILSTVPAAVRNYRSQQVPEDIIRASLNLQKGMENAIRRIGIPGSNPTVLYWWRLYEQGRLFTLGRFQYIITELSRGGTMLRNRKTGQKLLLAQEDCRFNTEGFIVQEGLESEDDQVTTFEETETDYSGYAVHPAGYILPGIRTCSKSEWDAVIRPGDTLLDMHIPAGGGMTPEAAYDSIAAAFRFFREHFPDRYVPAIICRSWIFNTQFEDMLPDSNLAKLMRKCYLFPCPSSGKDGFYFLFGRDYENPADAPHDTTYRRAMLSVLERGDRLRLGGMFFLEEDLEHYYEDAHYRQRFTE